MLLKNPLVKTKREACVVCLGFFDGVHLGHQKLIQKANEIKQEFHLKLCVHTYTSAPILFINPGIKYAELTDLSEKKELVFFYGADCMLISEFDGRIMHMSGEEFVDDVLCREMDVKHIVVGYDHKFGYKGKTDAECLKAICNKKGIGLSIIEPVYIDDNMLVSSSKIKQLILEGNYKIAEKMLGRSLQNTTIERIKLYYK